MKPANRILHVDGDSFFASCEIALEKKLEGRAVWVGGGRRGDPLAHKGEWTEKLWRVSRGHFTKGSAK